MTRFSEDGGVKEPGGVSHHWGFRARKKRGYAERLKKGGVARRSAFGAGRDEARPLKRRRNICRKAESFRKVFTGYIVLDILHLLVSDGVIEEPKSRQKHT